ncbi:4-hydroxy-tetrahydrodipicolinate synthase [Haloechinothrix sp. LS1_15]|uniref:4-hydroxy-tetrahydrodipicolinate synthase n=1 Tax=Haloechinothrix sp. LS1_15 TaxID=2652248 RepID=UPI002947253C|nr:4-hydroxy-tetrahydrodipicolinate synthase [Haloechinothrix sp. LS1_15]MDV6014332.1 4-hydroxy-tetrahydrodipicolinate synthase [Haloechinothrix sp. LS1_15]
MTHAPLGSILTALITPFDSEMRLNESAFVSMFHHVVRHGSDGIVACGTTGEAATLSNEEHLRVIELACAERPVGATVVASTGSNNTAQACAMTERATDLGADAILSVTPYYNRPNRRGLVQHFTEISRATDKPIILYNIPTRTGTDMPNDLLAELATIERIDYVKQANNANLAPVEGIGLYAGNDDVLARTLDLGGCGGILVASHIMGEQLRRMVDEPDRRADIDASLKPLYQALTVTTNPIPIKAALNLLGYPAGPPRLPLVAADERETEVIRQALIECGLLA